MHRRWRLFDFRSYSCAAAGCGRYFQAMLISARITHYAQEAAGDALLHIYERAAAFASFTFFAISNALGSRAPAMPPVDITPLGRILPSISRFISTSFFISGLADCFASLWQYFSINIASDWWRLAEMLCHDFSLLCCERPHDMPLLPAIDLYLSLFRIGIDMSRHVSADAILLLYFHWYFDGFKTFSHDIRSGFRGCLMHSNTSFRDGPRFHTHCVFAPRPLS